MTCTRPWMALALYGACSFQPGALPMAPAADAALDAAELPATCLDAWCTRKQIIIHGSEISGTPGQPMLLVRIESDADLALAAQDSGDDLRFVAADGTPLPYERERFDGTTGALLAWVQLPLLEPVDTTIYLYYGNASASDQQAGAAAWSNRYAAVWHLGEDSGTTSLADATSNANTAVATNGPTLGSPGVIGTGVMLDGTNDHLRVAASASLDATTGDATFALWVNWDSLTANHYQRVLASDHRFTAGGDGYEWGAQPGGDFYFYPWGGAETYNLGPSPFTAGTWHYLVATLDFALKEARVFVDGEPMAFTIENDSTAWTMLGTAGDWLWGANVSVSGPFGGKMDEIQVMRGTRSPDWIRTAFANQRPGSTMLTIGPQETLVP